MTPFLKYTLVSLVLFLFLTALGFRFWKPRNTTTVTLSSQTETQFVTDAQLLDTLYRTFKIAIKGTDPIALVQAKGNFQGKLSEMQQKPPAITATDTIFRRVIRNYYSSMKINEEAIQNQKGLAAKKQELNDKIEQLTRLNQRLEGRIDMISSQPSPAPIAK